MARFHDAVVDALQTLADPLGEVNATYEQIALAVHGGASADEVHSALIDLKDDGRLPGSPTFTSDMFFGRAPGGGGAFHGQLKSTLRALADRMNRVSGSYADVAKAMGVSPGQVHQGIIQLEDDYYFEGSPIITSDLFEVRLPDEK